MELRGRWKIHGYLQPTSVVHTRSSTFSERSSLKLKMKSDQGRHMTSTFGIHRSTYGWVHPFTHKYIYSTKDIHTEKKIESKCPYIKILYTGQGVVVCSLNLIILKADRVGSVWVQGHTGMYSELQDSQNYIENLWLKNGVTYKVQ